MLEKLCFSLNGSTQFQWENANFVSCVFFEPGGQCLLLISKDKVKGTEVAKLQFANRGAFVCFLLARLAMWQIKYARRQMMAVESPFIPPLERATIIPLFLKKKVFRYKPTVLRPLCGGEIFLDLMLEGLVEVEFPDELSNCMEMEWPDVVCFFCFNFILFVVKITSG